MSENMMTDLRGNTEIDAARVRPLRTQILVRVLPVESKTKGGLTIVAKDYPDQRKGSILARIIAVGPYVHEDIEPGMAVAILPSSGRWVGDGDNGDEQTPFRMIDQDEALAVVANV